MIGNGNGNSMFLATHGILARAASGGVAPVNTVAPAITGTAVDEYTLTCSTGTWTGTGSITYAYQWRRNGSNIGSATNSTYTLVTADVGQSILCVVTATDIVGSASANSNTVTPISNAQYFINQAAITDPTQQAAINTLVVNLKGYSIWSEIKAIYPFVGGTAATHKWNLKDPRDLDAAFRLVFNGGWTHSSTGATPNGTNAYADTKCNISTQISNTSHAFGIYSRTNSTSGTQVYGVYNGPIYIFQNNLSNGNFISGDTPNNVINYTANPSTSLLMCTRRSSTDFQAYRAGVSLGTNTNLISSFASLNFYLSARNDGGIANFYNVHQLAFAFLSDGLTDTEASNLYTAVQAFQTTLGRNV